MFNSRLARAQRTLSAPRVRVQVSGAERERRRRAQLAAQQRASAEWVNIAASKPRLTAGQLRVNESQIGRGPQSLKESASDPGTDAFRAGFGQAAPAAASKQRAATASRSSLAASYGRVKVRAIAAARPRSVRTALDTHAGLLSTPGSVRAAVRPFPEETAAEAEAHDDRRELHLDGRPVLLRCGHPTAWTILQEDGPNHLGLRYNELHEHQMALITSGCVPCSALRRLRGAGRLPSSSPPPSPPPSS